MIGRPARGVPALLAVMATLGVGMSAAQERDADLSVRVAFSPVVGRQAGWFRGSQCAVARAGVLLDKAIGRGLRLRDRVAWPVSSGTTDLYALRSLLVGGVEHAGADLVVGLVPTGNPDGTGTLHEEGLAAYSQGYVVLRVGRDLCATGRLLAHEIAHVFGGVHRAGPANLMDPGAPGSSIDELNEALFALHRDRSIRGQAPPLRGEMLRMMWRLARADLDRADTWVRVGVLAATMGKAETACTHYERALSIDSRQRDAWVNLGHARLQLGQYGEAESAYDAALALDPDDGLVHNNLAVVYLSTGRARDALDAAERARALGYEVSAALVATIRARLQWSGWPRSMGSQHQK